MLASSFTNDNVLIPGPSFHVDLAALDALHPIHYSRRLYIFRCDSTEQRCAQLAAFKVGLQALVSRCPILGGVIIPPPHNQMKNGREKWCSIASGDGIELVIRDLRLTIASFDKLKLVNFPSLELPYDPLIPVPAHIGDDDRFAACKVQFSAIDGGTIVSFAMSHSVADGGGTDELFRILSNETRLAQQPQRQLSEEEVSEKDIQAKNEMVGLDRTVLQNMISEMAFNINDHPAYVMQTIHDPIIFPSQEVPPHPFRATCSEIPILLHISAAGLAQLKADASLPGTPPISTHDALSALIWRSVLLVRRRRFQADRALSDRVTGSLFMPSDARRHLGLPPSYIGNAVYQLTAELDLSTLLSSSGLQHAASAIRRAITAVDPPLVCNYMTQLKEQWIEWGFMSTFDTTGVAMGTDWTSGSLYNDDWGEAFGPVIKYRYPSDGGGFNCILPKLVDGGAEMEVSVMQDEVTFLRGPEAFGKYL